MMKGIFLEESGVLKILLYITIFVGICSILFLLLIVPVSKDFQRISLRYQSQEDINVALQESLSQSQNKLKVFEEENEFMLSQFDFSFNEEQFARYLGQYAQNVKIAQIPIKDPQPYLQHDLNITANLFSLEDLYAFLDSLNKYKSLIQVDYPIVLEAKGGKILADGAFKVYYVNEVNASK